MNTYENLPVAVDLLAILLPPSIYAKIAEKLHPHVSSAATIAEALKGISAPDLKEIKVRVGAVAAKAKLVEEAILKLK